jgi:peptidoglycan hydrolase-like protein with peptidoglycan-binding domain
VINSLRPLAFTQPCSPEQDIRRLQIALIKKGYEIEPNGRFDALTQWAVEKFQLRVGLPITGIADGATQQILYARALYFNEPYLVGSDVLEVQFLLLKIGYDVRVDGVFDLRTRQAVMDFQRFFHLPEDGVLQGVTLTRLLYMPLMAQAS